MDTVKFRNPEVEDRVRKALKKEPDAEDLLVKEGRRTSVTSAGAARVSKLVIRTSALTEADWPDLAKLTGLKKLEVFSFGLTGLAGFPSLPALSSFRLRAGEGLFDISPLSGCTALRELDLEGLNIESGEALAALVKLRSLNMSYTGLSTCTPLAGLTHLRNLKIHGNPIGDLLPLAGLTGLTVLHMNSTGSGDISPLSEMRKLRVLSAAYGSIRDVSPLAGMQVLDQLILSDNQIKDVEPFLGCGALRSLDLTDNPIENASILGKLQSLESLSLSAREEYRDEFPGFERADSLRGHARSLGRPNSIGWNFSRHLPRPE